MKIQVLEKCSKYNLLNRKKYCLNMKRLLLGNYILNLTSAALTLVLFFVLNFMCKVCLKQTLSLFESIK